MYRARAASLADAGRRDATPAIEHYSRQARNTEAERLACEIRLRAERRAGEILSATEKPRGGDRGNQHTGGKVASRNLGAPKSLSDLATSSHGERGLETLSEKRNRLGISDQQASRWRQLAAVPEAQFEAALAAPTKPSTTGILAAISALVTRVTYL